MVRDVREILPDTPILRYQSGFGAGSPSLYSNLFRFALLHQHGGWWVDLDVVALRPFPSAANPVLGLVRSRHGPSRAGSAVLGLPAKSEFTACCLEILRLHDPSAARWGELGPGPVSQVAKELTMERFMRPPETFFPVETRRFWDLIRPGPLWPEAVGVHLWQNLWRHHGIDPDRAYPAGSPYEQLLRRYHPEAAAAARAPAHVPLLLLRSIPRRARMWVQSRRRARRGPVRPLQVPLRPSIVLEPRGGLPVRLEPLGRGQGEERMPRL